MRLPDPIANTTTEAYLAYKAGVLAKGDLKPKLYEPYIHLDAWLAYWTGLTEDYPNKGHGKNLFNKNSYNIGNLYINQANVIEEQSANRLIWIECEPNTTYTVQSTSSELNRVFAYTKELPTVGVTVYGRTQISAGRTSATLTTGQDAKYLVYRVWHTSVSTETFQEAIDSLQIEVGSEPSEYEPYEIIPEMLTDEEAYIAYLSGVTDTYPEEFRDPADIRVAGYLRYLVSARFGRPEYPVTNEELYLSMQKPPYVPSGDPSSDIELDGTIEAPFVDVKMYGDTYQQSYTGKNLLKFVPSTAGLNGLTVNYDEASGVVRVSGTPTQNWANIDSTTKTMSLKAGSYILSVDNPSPLYRLNLRVYDPTASGGYVDFHGGDGENYIKFTLDHDLSDVVMRVYIDHNYDLVAVDWSFKIMIESGSDITLPYEPYVGGKESPSPEYPQKIKNAGGTQRVYVFGKNLFDKDKALDNYFYTSTGSKSTYSKAQFYNNKFLPKSNKITMSFSAAHDKQNGSNIEANVRIVQYDASGNFISRFMSRDNGHTFTLDANTKSFILCVDNGPDAWFDDLQIEYGSTATAYEPYSSNDYEINLGKNLFNKNDVVNGIPSATDGSIISTSSIGRTSGYIPVMANTTYSHTGHPVGWAVIAWYKADKSFIARVDNITTTISPNEAAYARVSCALDNLDTCQFEAGEPTSYAPYFEPIELCKLGTYQDYIYKDGDDWKVHKATSKVLVDGTVGTISNPSANRFNLDGLITDYKKQENRTFALCDQYISLGQTANNAQFNTNASGYECCINFGSVSANVIRFKNTKISTISDFTDALKANPLTMYYVLATAADTAITNQALIDQLDALVAGGAENGTTYIKVDATDPNLPGLLYVEAPKYD